MTEERKTLGQTIRAARQEKTLNQRQLAALAGVSRSHLTNLEADRFGASPQAAERLATILGLEPESLQREHRPRPARPHKQQVNIGPEVPQKLRLGWLVIPVEVSSDGAS
jgi:transcriptional regulator with XRE-family HTH domain